MLLCSVEIFESRTGDYDSVIGSQTSPCTLFPTSQSCVSCLIRIIVQYQQ